ncbi:DUF1934 domain-containing protein [Peptostreptococcus faecalis]|uniref:DUF1934 domain-containing protein n=1 Tax=Peptostreptococcus faecalis TaxID=2045015 RepID=UPI000C7B4B4F|nr:DUF1934 domain-containing protein [Peptostreptococcus faecalis]
MNVKVKIKTSQYTEGGEVQTIESFYNGEQIEKNGSLYVSFLEYDTVKDSRNTIKISDGEVLILKSGDINSKIRFIESKSFKSKYKTLYGDFDMSVYTYKISKKISDEGVKLNLDYKISIRGLLEANNRIEIKVIPEA